MGLLESRKFGGPWESWRSWGGGLGGLGGLGCLGRSGSSRSGVWVLGVWASLGPWLNRIRQDQANRHKNMLQIKLETCRWHRDTPRQDDPSSKTGCGNGADAETN